MSLDDVDDPIYGFDAIEGDEFCEFSNPAGVEEAWREVQSELPAGWSVAGVSRGRRPTDWVAQATGRRGNGASGVGPNPRAALKDLTRRDPRAEGGRAQEEAPAAVPVSRPTTLRRGAYRGLTSQA
jgi:hypothetical protein